MLSHKYEILYDGRCQVTYSSPSLEVTYTMEGGRMPSGRLEFEIVWNERTVRDSAGRPAKISAEDEELVCERIRQHLYAMGAKVIEDYSPAPRDWEEA